MTFWSKTSKENSYKNVLKIWKMNQKIKLKWKNLGYLQCSINISKCGNTTKKHETMEQHWGAIVIPPRLVIAINHSILGIFEISKWSGN